MNRRSLIVVLSQQSYLKAALSAVALAKNKQMFLNKKLSIARSDPKQWRMRESVGRNTPMEHDLSAVYGGFLYVLSLAQSFPLFRQAVFNISESSNSVLHSAVVSGIEELEGSASLVMLVPMKCRDWLHELVKEEIEKKDSSTEEWKIAMERSFNRMDNEGGLLVNIA
ncbi:putative protein phosphatase 2C 24 [Camellia lanceoleosa]|uniref:Uncharacterized protein n=1 Tax=Camellia lanceoleosa TaxID=1840588 RepID=A0ACC0I4N2_9ERIC|nr:putative protein phosphatase 2C 24 [Camellia lanceoleosa]